MVESRVRGPAASVVVRVCDGGSAYDSAGRRSCRRRVPGKRPASSDLESCWPRAAAGGTRHGHPWATHGAPTDVNAHRNLGTAASRGSNGIIENYVPLRDELSGGDRMTSETDTEWPHLLGQGVGARLRSPCARLRRLQGAFTLVAWTPAPDAGGPARRNPPVVGSGGENFVASEWRLHRAHREAIELGQTRSS